MEDDPLSQLLVDKQEVDRKALANMIAPYAKIDRETGEPHLTAAYTNLDNKQKILVVLLSRKAARLLELPIRNEELTPTEISHVSGVKTDSVKPTVSKLAKERLLGKNGSAYYVPNYAIHAVGELMSNRDETD